MMKVSFLACGYLIAATSVWAVETVTFPASDGLVVTADLYMAYAPTAPMILLFHQAGYSRGEYLEIAPRLNALGFNALGLLLPLLKIA